MRNTIIENYQDTDKENRGFKPSVEWMREKYNMLNNELFDGVLGDCNFTIFTSGKGSEGGVLGSFHLAAPNLRIDTYTGKPRIARRAYKGDDSETWHYCRKENFFDMCQPTISLNGNYTGTEYGFLSTLIHEMCHYCTYMNGIPPSKGHGVEFLNIANYIAKKSNNYFNIERLANAEEMSHFDLNDEMKAKKEKRQAAIKAVFDFREREVHLTLTNSTPLINQITDFKLKNPYSHKVIVTNDNVVIDAIHQQGYRANVRTWKYWNVTSQPFLNLLDNAKKDVFINPEYDKDKDLISETLRNVLSEMIEDNSYMELSPDMDLGAYSPLEL